MIVQLTTRIGLARFAIASKDGKSHNDTRVQFSITYRYSVRK
ncbi:MAG TPA: hypothetical protein VJ323_11960 [Bryobacteraceae bacterium]|nr:hypothetical protein [Bryobacteraceae bacterium]